MVYNFEVMIASKPDNKKHPAMETTYQHGLRFAEYEHSFSDKELLEFAENEYPGNQELQQQWVEGAKRHVCRTRFMRNEPAALQDAPPAPRIRG